MKEFDLNLKLRNNRLRERRLVLGLSNADLAKLVGMPASVYGRFENLKVNPISRKTGTWKVSALKLADFFKVAPGELFPSAVFDVVEPETSVKLDGEEALLLSQMSGVLLGESSLPDDSEKADKLGSSIEQALIRLSPREGKVLRAYFGLDGDDPMTQEQVGVGMGGISGAAVSVIFRKAIRRLRHPTRAKFLKDYR